MGATVLRSGAALGAEVDAFVARVVGTLAGRPHVAVVGVRRGGLALSKRLVSALRAGGMKVDIGTVDVALYRDDTHLAWPRPQSGTSELPFAIDGQDVVLVDDVFWTGRTARAAMDAVLDFGRPRRLWLVTFVARDGRELPMNPDVFGIHVDAKPDERVELRLVEDGHATDELVLATRSAP